MFQQLRRRGLVWVLGAGVLWALGSLACGGAMGGAPSGPAFVNVVKSQFDVEIENVSGGPLTEVRVSIIPVGRATRYSAFAGRVENAYKQRFSFNDFRGDDGTPFNLRVVRPQGIVVEAKDMQQKPLEMEVPWK